MTFQLSSLSQTFGPWSLTSWRDPTDILGNHCPYDICHLCFKYSEKNSHTLSTVTMVEIHSSSVLLDGAKPAVFPPSLHVPQHFQESTLTVTPRTALDTELFWTLHLGQEMGEHVTEACNLTFFKNPAQWSGLKSSPPVTVGSSSLQNVWFSQAQSRGDVEHSPPWGSHTCPSTASGQLEPSESLQHSCAGLSLAWHRPRTRIRHAAFLTDESCAVTQMSQSTSQWQKGSSKVPHVFVSYWEKRMLAEPFLPSHA